MNDDTAARIETKLDEILDFIEQIRCFGKAATEQNGMAGMMARSMIPPTVLRR